MPACLSTACDRPRTPDRRSGRSASPDSETIKKKNSRQFWRERQRPFRSTSSSSSSSSSSSLILFCKFSNRSVSKLSCFSSFRLESVWFICCFMLYPIISGSRNESFFRGRFSAAVSFVSPFAELFDPFSIRPGLSLASSGFPSDSTRPVPPS